MPHITIPGGTSPGLGRSIVTALSQLPSNKITILSRKTSTTPQWLSEFMNKDGMGKRVEIVGVDYEDEEELAKVLSGVDIVICVLLPKDGTWCDIQLRLLRVSLKVGVTRFAPAEFGCGPLATPHVSMLAAQMPVWEACRAAVRNAKADSRNFEWAGFHVGLFMNYLGYGCKDEFNALAGKSNDGEFIFYMKDMEAKIPLTKDGKTPRMTLTEIGDVGRFVSAACNLPHGEWRENFGMVGSTVRMDEIVRIIQEVRGREMDVKYRTLDQVRKEKEECKDEMRRFWLELEEMCAMDEEGRGIVPPLLNERCPDVKPTSVEEYVRKFWSGQ